MGIMSNAFVVCINDLMSNIYIARIISDPSVFFE